MAFTRLKPFNPSTRSARLLDRKQLWRGSPVPGLTRRAYTRPGRNSYGRITCRSRRNRFRRRIREVDQLYRVPTERIRVEVDPNRSALIELAKDSQGLFYKPVITGSGKVVRLGECAPKDRVCSVEIRPGSGARFARAAGQFATVQRQEDRYTVLALRSGEIRRVHSQARAVLGVIGNEDHRYRMLGKAGRAFHMGRRPRVRGMAMQVYTHPNGGKSGKTKGRILKTKWGKVAKGLRTRRRKDSFLIRRRRG